MHSVYTRIHLWHAWYGLIQSTLVVCQQRTRGQRQPERRELQQTDKDWLSTILVHCEELRLAPHPNQHRHRYKRESVGQLVISIRADVPHVRRGLDRRDELQRSVSDTNQANDGTWNDAEPLLANDNGTDEDVDWSG
jgi:hypothetical protein